MSEPSPLAVTPGEQVRDVAAADWHEEVAAAVAAGFDMLDFLTGVDTPVEQKEQADLALVCHLYAVGTGHHPVPGLLLRTLLAPGEPVVSITDLLPGAAWHERETHEMFGVDVAGFDDGTGRGLRPLLLPDGFEGTPLRKSFVLAARVAKPWPGAKEPGESGDTPPRRTGRRRVSPPGLPDPEWGPR